jgi:hypothetical protein
VFARGDSTVHAIQVPGSGYSHAPEPHRPPALKTPHVLSIDASPSRYGELEAHRVSKCAGFAHPRCDRGSTGQVDAVSGASATRIVIGSTIPSSHVPRAGPPPNMKRVPPPLGPCVPVSKCQDLPSRGTLPRVRGNPQMPCLGRTPDCHPPIAPICLAIQPAKQGTSTRTLKGGRAVDHCHTRGRNEPQPPISRFSNSKRPRDQALTEMKLCRSVAALPALPWIGPILGSTRLWPLGSKLASRGFSVTGCPIRAMTSLSQKQASQGCPARGCLVLAEQPMRDSRS